VRSHPWVPIGLTALGFSFSTVTAKALLLSGLTVWSIFPPRYLIGCAAAIGWMAARRRLFSPTRSEWGMGTVLGVLNLSGSSALLFLSTDLLPASVFSLLVGLIPLATVLAAHLIVPGEHLRARQLPGFGIALVGVAVLARGDLGAIERGWEGLAWAVGGVVLAGLGGAYARLYAIRAPAARLVVPQFVTGLASGLLIAWPLGGFSGLDGLGGITWLGLVAFGTVGTALPFICLLWASEVAPASRVALIGYIVPILGALGGIVFLDETATPALLIGGSLILIGVVVADRASVGAPAAPAR
jgi:drug/metabolite transporter (DMT)-like permease